MDAALAVATVAGKIQLAKLWRLIITKVGRALLTKLLHQWLGCQGSLVAGRRVDQGDAGIGEPYGDQKILGDIIGQSFQLALFALGLDKIGAALVTDMDI